uniref:Uncharacterized protein n=1 Tax=Parastrongyloides trichosuri TaxID=131310 RepID=A0A0N4Z494_PARTI
MSNINNDNDQWTTIQEKTTIIQDGKNRKKFHCQFLSIGGLYRIKLKNNDVEIISPTIPLSPVPNQYGLINGKPSINIRSDSIFPHCSSTFTLSWEKTSCSNLNTNFRVQVTGTTDLRKVRDWIYIEEILLPNDKKTIDIDCSLFDIIFEKYCFELISTDNFLEKTQVWDKKCVKTEPLKRIDGGYSNWSTFTPCHSTSQGDCVKKRYRKCDNPKPSGGLDCQGPIVDIKKCDSSSCPLPTTMVSSSLPLISSQASSSCTCGCEIREKSGTFFVGYGKFPFCDKDRKMEWILKSPDIKYIHRKFFDAIPFQEYYITIDRHFLNKNDIVKIFKDKNLIWQNEQSEENELVVSSNDTIRFVINSSNRSHSNKVSGIIVNYVLRDNLYMIENIKYPSNTIFCIKNYCSRSLFFGIFGLGLSLLLLLPTILCFCITKLLREDRWKKLKEEGTIKTKFMEQSNSIRSEMIKSNNTNSTHLPELQTTLNKDKKFVTCRSIGIQLSSQNTPSCSRSMKIHSSETTTSSRNTPRVARSSLSFASMNEMEYDYYEPILPGSFLYPPQFDLSSDIDIDSIIRQEAKVLLSDPTVDAHTQI